MPHLRNSQAASCFCIFQIYLLILKGPLFYWGALLWRVHCLMKSPDYRKFSRWLDLLLYSTLHLCSSRGGVACSIIDTFPHERRTQGHVIFVLELPLSLFALPKHRHKYQKNENTSMNPWTNTKQKYRVIFPLCMFAVPSNGIHKYQSNENTSANTKINRHCHIFPEHEPSLAL